MITKDQKFEKKSAHNRYTDTYIEILSTYKDQLNNGTKNLFQQHKITWTNRNKNTLYKYRK